MNTRPRPQRSPWFAWRGALAETLLVLGALLNAPLPVNAQATPPVPETWTRCATEGVAAPGNVCTVPGAREVRYGVPGAYTIKVVTSSITCSDAAFGVTVPTPYQKYCEYGSRPAPVLAKAAKPPPPPPPAPAPPPKVAKGEILGGIGGATGAAKKARPPTQATMAAKKSPVVEAFFGTDRTMIPAAKPGERFTASRGELQLGVVRVSIPFSHKLGEIERPKWYRFEFNEDPEKHIVLLEAKTLTQQEFAARLKGMANVTGKQSAFVFVHGYNVTFEDAALRTAQMAFDLGLKSIPAFYSWPSQGAMAEYTVDEANVEWTEPHLRRFLTAFAEASGALEISVIAHSMGSRAVTHALAALLKDRPDLRPRFRDLILAAPDIDADVFKESLLPQLTAMQQRVTLYSSSNDKALMASKEVHGNPRAGETGPKLVVTSGLETIDASNIDTDFLGHSYFAQTRALLTDFALLLNNNMRADQRPTLESRGAGNAMYWAFRP